MSDSLLNDTQLRTVKRIINKSGNLFLFIKLQDAPCDNVIKHHVPFFFKLNCSFCFNIIQFVFQTLNFFKEIAVISPMFST